MSQHAPSTPGTVPTIPVELMLLRWAESSNGGASITFQLADAASLEPFKAMTTAKGGKAGQRFMAALALLGDDERPVAVPGALPAAVQTPAPAAAMPGGPLSKLAGRWCAAPEFQQWMKHQHGATFANAFGEVEARELDPAEYARQVILWLCGVASRAELDHSAEAADDFHELVRLPFAAYLEGR